MVISSEDIKAEIQIPEKVKAEILDNVIIVEGRLGKLKKNIIRIPVVVMVQDKKIVIRPHGRRKKDLAITNTVRSIIRNMLTGVEKGFTYKLKIVSAHFPMSVKLRGDKVNIENYFGERSPRTSQIVGEAYKGYSRWRGCACARSKFGGRLPDCCKYRAINQNERERPKGFS